MLFIINKKLSHHVIPWIESKSTALIVRMRTGISKNLTLQNETSLIRRLVHNETPLSVPELDCELRQYVVKRTRELPLNVDESPERLGFVAFTITRKVAPIAELLWGVSIER
ncbi:hypothetical protein ACT691_20410 [Vibrio metschnikovii]